MTIDEIKIMRLAGQHLTDKTEKLTAAQDLLGYQAQFYRNAFHSARLRTQEALSPDSWGEGLVKSWSQRGTVHVFPENDLPLFIRSRKTPEDVCEEGWYPFLVKMGIYISPERNRYFARVMVDAIAQGRGTREELKEICFANGLTESEAEHVFCQWGGTIGALANIGVLCFKVQEKKEYTLCPPFEPMPGEAAMAEVARRYFTHFGPATLRDFSYFMKKPQAALRPLLEPLPVQSFALEKQTYYYIENGPEYDSDLPACVFLAGFDQLMLGYEKLDSLFLPREHLRGIFNRAGIVFPALLVDGTVAGRWKEEKKTIAVTLFAPLSARRKKSVVREAERLWSDKAVEWREL